MRRHPKLTRFSWAIPLLVLIVVLLMASGTLVHLLTESWWFTAVGFGSVFWTRIRWQVGIWLGVLVLYVLFLTLNYCLAVRFTQDRPFVFRDTPRGQELALYLPSLVRYGAIALIAIISLDGAAKAAGAWETILKYLNPTSFDQTDPIFQQDIGFYLFRLPCYEGLQQGLIGLLGWTLLLCLAFYALKGEIRLERGWKYFITGQVKAHLCVLLAAMAFILALGFWLDRFNLLYSPTGASFGAGYTDVHARLQAYWMMGFVTLAIAILFVISLWRSGFSLPSFGIGVYVIVLVVVSGLYPWAQQKLVVEPNELAKETPYIANTIGFTRRAYGLDQVQSESFPAESAIDRADLQANQSTIDNIRLWDYRPLLSTYRQLQEFRLYYRFQDVDIDRYTLDNDYRQVMLSGREMMYSQVPSEAQTWVNERLKFTHGYGLVMSPVNRVTSDGLPELFVKNIPPESSVDLAIEQPRIYYGEESTSYIFTGSSTPEFDYPQGDDNVVNQYDGGGGVPMGSIWRRLAYAYDLGSLKILISNYFTERSRIHYHRQVQQRVRQVAPFLALDDDPYVTVIDGRLKWIVDAYTISDRYPYSEPLGRSSEVQAILQGRTITDLASQGSNYIRDAVKVVVDAYDGSMHFFVVDEQDPVLNTYRQIFPDLFEPMTAVPEAVRAHFRYPLDLFKIQAQMYRAYHMANPEVFYNREDLWRFPTQIYEGEQVQMEPYYIIMRLPQETQEEFIQISPFTPVNKDNMVAWLAGRSDGDKYGKLLLYEFPKQQLVYGPSQIEARIDQTPEISQQLTLWSQEGSRVIRGDLQVIPIDQSLLYIEPVYLRSEQGELPELRRVIVAYDDQIVMRNTLEACLEAIFGTASAIPTPAPSSEEQPLSPDTTTVSPDIANLIQSALEAYETSQDALSQGDWPAYGEAQQRLQRILQQLEQTQSSN
ncbi:uncharacterized protein XM38_036750 [Halomicronema hongdechloris C2206]|uniref:UPF0182 protein XM38_036750 n=1 Tax=Halomicronema hongdechloris C2206 TaxID=1641165 RepID=A0A1Z3HRE8_9CYAN|nr:UPF0182 family protein [Halomicronema hongdechloris]ASC72717.1 uncharacterized protein XM38_036750 [Halomicronema hongdechloris C2206]